MIDSVMSGCCSRITAAMELATRYTTLDTILEIDSTSLTAELACSIVMTCVDWSGGKVCY